MNEGDIVAEKSCETGATYVEQVKVEAAIGQNEEEFKEINETVQQTSDAAPNQSFRDIPVHIPLLELPEGQSHSQALITNGVSPLGEQADHKASPASALQGNGQTSTDA